MSNYVRRGHMKYVEVSWSVGGEVGTHIGKRLVGWMNDSLDEWLRV